MYLKSAGMSLSGAELRWLPLLGKTGKIAMRWSCFLNRNTYPVVEKTFEGIANTRKKLLIHWAEGTWGFLSDLANILATDFPAVDPHILEDKKIQASDFSELFIINEQGKVISSTYTPHIGMSDLNHKAVAEGLKAQFLHGPYEDKMTEAVGPSSSKFHDEVTLMFYQPIVVDRKIVGCLCGRIPTDVMSDLIQREAGHIYPESGDNYIFMVRSSFDPSIKQGTALSRSRFEDNTFCFGDNLKQGVKTSYGDVRVSRHTELELRFTDPATGELHPGVRETIRNGENLFVTYPGYSDYRHIPVIGKGVTFRLPGSPDHWGMMCEGDLEEVYRRRTISYKFTVASFFTALTAWLAMAAMINYTSMDKGLITIILGVVMFLSVFALRYITLQPVANHLVKMSDYFLNIAECDASLKDRLKADDFKADEIGELGKWINSFVDKIDDTVNQVLAVAKVVAAAAADLSSSTATVAQSTGAQSEAASSTATAVEEMMASVDQVAEQANQTESISGKASTLSEQGKDVVQKATTEMFRIAEVVNQSSRQIADLGHRSTEISGIVNVIKDIADQTNLLALNAAIEAAGAGEHGRGFAVVADEVRELAKRTAKSAAEITDMIKAIQQETSKAVTTMEQCSMQAQRGVKLATEAGESLEQIYQGANQNLDMVQSIAAATKEQSVAGIDIARNIERIAQMAEQNKVSVDMASVSARNLRQLSADLQKAVSKFTI